MHPSSRRAGCVGEQCASVLGKHLSLRRVFCGLGDADARWVVEQEVRLVNSPLGRKSL